VETSVVLISKHYYCACVEEVTMCHRHRLPAIMRLAGIKGGTRQKRKRNGGLRCLNGQNENKKTAINLFW
jgi:hypothetical protein